jgi:DNA-nicking Smr family endonuclease
MVPEPLPRPRPKPPATPAPGDLAALNAAYRGVQPIARPKRGRVVSAARVPKGPAPPDPEEQAARERLSALVSGGVRFEVRWDDGSVEGLQQGASDKLLRRLSGKAFEPEATLDLHGMRREQAARAVHELIRAQHRRGVRRLLFIVGKGVHSEGGQGVLADALVHALTQGVAAPLVAAFATAGARHGGRGAIAVELI